MYSVVTSKGFRKRLVGLPADWQRRILKKIEIIAQAPYASHANVTKLQGREGYRLRVGDWRILYDLEDNELIMLVLEMDTRGGIY